jgi:methylglutaconyl-CoA hydratase
MKANTRLVSVQRDDRGVATVELNRPERHNALSAALVDALSETLAGLAADQATRAIILTGVGPTFCAGADIGEMRSAGAEHAADNQRDASRLAGLLARLDNFPMPTVARVQGNAFGGAIGLIAACDIALGSELAVFALTEVRLGLVPAMISPYVVRAIGERQARRYFLTGERFGAAIAERLGLLHLAVPAAQLDATLSGLTDELLLGAPGAQAEAKKLLRRITGRSSVADAQLADETARWIARLRASAEGREGLSAFLEKRPPSWRRT